jgi:uncharacterized RDD family membrane protein YckC
VGILFSEPDSKDGGERSGENRRRFTLAAGSIAFVFLLIQIVIPFLLPFLVMENLTGVAVQERHLPHLWDTVLWMDSLWYVDESIPRRMSPREEGFLQRLDPRGRSAPVTVASALMEDPHLLVGTDRLWIISPEDVHYIRGVLPTTVNIGWRLGDISAPFLLDGRPAVFEERPAGVTLTVLEGDHWQRGALLELQKTPAETSAVAGLRVVPCNGRFHLFMEMGETLYHREGLPGADAGEEGSWEPVVHAGGQWTALCLEGKPTVFTVKQNGYRDVLASYQSNERGWSPHGEVTLNTWRALIGVVPTGRGSDLFVLSAGAKGTLGLSEVRDGKLEGKGFRFPNQGAQDLAQILRIFVALAVAYPVLALLLTIILSAMMNRWRAGRYRSGHADAQLASLWRRGCASTIDGLILAGPLAADFLRVVSPRMFPSRIWLPTHPFWEAALLLRCTLWAVAGFLTFSLLEGRLGSTPGKWVAGIRVLGTDLNPCGFPRGLARNLLKLVDSSLNFMPGILATAFSERRQRFGDMAARTVVVRSGSVTAALVNPGEVGQGD